MRNSRLFIDGLIVIVIDAIVVGLIHPIITLMRTSAASGFPNLIPVVVLLGNIIPLADILLHVRASQNKE